MTAKREFGAYAHFETKRPLLPDTRTLIGIRFVHEMRVQPILAWNHEISARKRKSKYQNVYVDESCSIKIKKKCQKSVKT